MRAESLFEQSKFADGIDTLLLAVESNAGDAGRDLELAASSALDKRQLEHGEQQLKRMLADRPEMALCLKPGDSFWNRIVRKFAGEDAGKLVIWDAKDPEPFNSDSVAEKNEVFIQVRDRRDCSSEYECDALWAGVILELFRTAITARSDLRARMQAGQLEPEDYVLEQMAITERAMEQTRAFFLKVYAPLRVASGAKELWPNEWHAYRFFPSKAVREKAWRSDSRWEHYLAAYKVFWVGSPAAYSNPELARKYLQEVQSQEANLGIGLRTILYCYLTIFHLQQRDVRAAQDALKVADYLWPDLPGVEHCRTQVAMATRQSIVSRKPTLPESSLLLAETAKSKFRSGDVDGAMESVLRAIALNPNDAGARWNENSDTPLSPEMLHRGEDQLKTMLKDRPSMGNCLSPGDDLWNWAVRRFAGERTGHLIEWNPADPGEADARCWRSKDGRFAAIQIRDLEDIQALSPAEKFNRYWAFAVFELYNVSHGAGKDMGLIDDAREGKLTRDAFIVAALDQEMIAVQCSRMFYLKKFVPFMQAKNISTDPKWWYSFTFFLDDDSRLRYYRSLHHWQHYGSIYDQLRLVSGSQELKRAQELQNAGNVNEAMEIVEAVLAADPTSTSALYFKGSLLLKSGDAEAALNAFDQGLELDELHTGLLYGRGQANVRLGRFEDASHDFTTLIKAAPNQPFGYYGRARAVLANARPENSELRRAVTDAHRACELSNWKSDVYLALLLKAYTAVDDPEGIRSVEAKLEQLKSKAQENKDAYWPGFPRHYGSLAAHMAPVALQPAMV